MVQAIFSETYTFYTNVDDGIRLYVEGQLLIDQWIDQAPTEYSATIPLQAGQKYSITMEYYENGGGAVAQLRWSSPSQPKEVIPQAYLFAPPYDQTIAFDPIPDKLGTDPPFTITATASSGLPVNFSIVSGPATVVGNTVTLTGGAGTVTVRASQGGDAIYNAAPDVDQIFDVTIDQVITFDPIPDKLNSDPPFIVTAAASSGLPVSFSIVSGPATVAGNTVTLTGPAGTVIVRASQPGDASYNPAPDVDQSFNVTTDQVITFDPIPDKLSTDPPFTITATASSGLTVTFSIISGPATLGGANNDEITLTGTGTVTVRASQAGDATWNPAPDVDQSFNVTEPSNLPDPLAHWPLDGTGQDIENGHDGHPYQWGSFSTDSQIGSQSMSLDGVDDYLDLVGFSGIRLYARCLQHSYGNRLVEARHYQRDQGSV